MSILPPISIGVFNALNVFVLPTVSLDVHTIYNGYTTYIVYVHATISVVFGPIFGANFLPFSRV